MVVCRRSNPGSGQPQAIQGRITSARGGQFSGNSPGIMEVAISRAYTDSAKIQEFNTISGRMIFTSVDIISIDGVEYVALKATTGGGDPDRGMYFSGMLYDGLDDPNFLTRVRASDSNVTVVTSNIVQSHGFYSTRADTDSSQSATWGSTAGSNTFRIINTPIVTFENQGLILSSDKVIGIGTDNPDQDIDIYTANPAIQLKHTDGSRWRVANEGGIFKIIQSGVAERFELNSSGDICIGDGVPDEKLDVRGSLRVAALDGLTYDRATRISPIAVDNFGDYQRPVIALAYKYPGSGTVNKSGYWGRIYASRGSTAAGHTTTMIQVLVTTAYNNQTLTGMGLGPSVFRFVSFTYDSTDYIGVQYNTDASSQIWLDGYYSRRYGFKPFSVAQSSVSSITAINATHDGRLTSTSSSVI